MPIPSLEKTWQYSLNNYYAASSTHQRGVLRALKDILKGFSTNPWTVVGSSDSTTANMSGTDLWTADSKLVYVSASGVHSWIVLKQAGIATNFSLCIDLIAGGSANYWRADIYVSHGGYNTATGTTSVRPSPTTGGDEQEITAANEWGINIGSTTPTYLHVMQSDDGQCTRAFQANSGGVRMIWIIDKMKNPRGAITQPYAAICHGSSTNSASEKATFTNLYEAANVRVRFNAINANAYLTSESVLNDALGQRFVVPDDYDGSLPVSPIGVLQTVTASAKGWYGRLFDLYWGNTGMVTGDSYPETGTKIFSAMRDLLVPSNGTRMRAG